jgi:hypothetical protein
MPVFNHLTEREFIPEDAIWIMRPSRWGNPFVLGPDGDRETVLAKHKAWLWNEVRSGHIPLEEIAALDGAALVCCCTPKACHGETLLAAASWAAKTIEQRRTGDDRQ